MKIMISTLFFLILVPVNSKEVDNLFSSFTNILNDNISYFSSCAPVIKSSSYELCDKTVVNINELKKLFKMTPEQLLSFIKEKGIEYKINCSKDKKGPFDRWCSNSGNDSSLKKRKTLHGQYIPSKNMILINGSATVGILIHEYIHYLQFKNKNRVFGLVYKKDRVDLQNLLLKKMDQKIELVKLAEKKGNRKEVLKYARIATGYSSKMQSFSKWQDLIDEKNIFLLYLKFGKNFGATKEDLKLASINMGFICSRDDLKSLLPEKQCKLATYKERAIYKAVKKIIKELRPRPEMSLVDSFLEKLPKIHSKLSLKEKIQKLSNYIYKDWKIIPDTSYLSRKSKDNLLPDSTLLTRKAHCVGLSTLYLLAAEKLRIKAALVRTPMHVFVRLCSKKECLNVETLKFGDILSDSWYIKNYLIPTQAVKEGHYLRSLYNAKDLAASIYLGLGYIANSYKQMGLARFMYEKSRDSSRGFVDSYSNLASIYGANGKLRMARVNLNTAIKINPYHYTSYINLGVLEAKLNHHKTALIHFAKAISINETSIRAYWNRGNLYLKQKKLKSAILDFRKILIINSHYCQVAEKLLSFGKQLDQKLVNELKKALISNKQSSRCLSL